jgi:hypothetical protein
MRWLRAVRHAFYARWTPERVRQVPGLFGRQTLRAGLGSRRVKQKTVAADGRFALRPIGSGTRSHVWAYTLLCHPLAF